MAHPDRTIIILLELNQNYLLVKFSPYPVNYPGQNTATVVIGFAYPVTWQAETCYAQVTINAIDPNTGQILATGNASAVGYYGNYGFLGADYITRYTVTLPTIPDSFFGIPLDFGGSPTQNGYGFPIVTGGQIFQELFYVSIIGLVLAAMLSAIFGIFGNLGGGGGGKNSIFYTILTGSVFGLFAIIIMLPLYNIFAVMMNGLSYWIMNPTMPTFNGAVLTTNDLMSKGFTVINANGILSSGIWSVITGSFGAGLNIIAMFVLWLMIPTDSAAGRRSQDLPHSRVRRNRSPDSHTQHHPDHKAPRRDF